VVVGGHGQIHARGAGEVKMDRPDYELEMVTAPHVERAMVELKRKKDHSALRKVRFERFDEGSERSDHA
jgi:hypothetical protein